MVYAKPNNLKHILKQSNNVFFCGTYVIHFSKPRIKLSKFSVLSKLLTSPASNKMFIANLGQR